MARFHFAAGALVALACAMPLHAATLQDGWTSYDQANYANAAQVFRSLNPIPPQALGALCEMAVANKAVSTSQQDLKYCQDAVAANDPQGQVSLGSAYLTGHRWLALERSETLGLGLLGGAVVANYPVASNVLCSHYYRANQAARAAPFCKVSAAAGLPGGLRQLAAMSMEGKGAVQDFDKARKFALLGASYGDAGSFVLLGDIAAGGDKGAKRDPVAAYAWYALAAAAAPDWDRPAALRDGLGLDGAKVAQGQKLATGWKAVPPPAWRSLYAGAAPVAAAK